MKHSCSFRYFMRILIKTTLLLLLSKTISAAPYIIKSSLVNGKLSEPTGNKHENLFLRGHLPYFHVHESNHAHEDRIILRTNAESTEYGFFLENPTDDNYPLWTGPKPSVGQMWPKPRMYQTFQNITAAKIDDIEFTVTGNDNDIITKAVKRYEILIAQCTAFENYVDQSKVRHNRLRVEITCRKNLQVEYPNEHMDESYNLTVKAGRVQLQANEKWGIIRGLETLSQLTFCHHNYHNQILIRDIVIRDFPRFPHRGLHIDTARHFMSKEIILENIEAMAFNKMNVFHWHIVDDQSFPFQSKIFPKTWQESSYHGRAKDYIYTHEDIKEIVEFARLRGIRVIPEFDSPDHTHALAHAYPHLPVWCKQDKNWYLGPLNPILESTYDFMKKLLHEVTTLFPDKYLHLGMDEVSLSCWELNSTLKEYVATHKLKETRELVSIYAKRLLKIVENLGRKPIMWEDITGAPGLDLPRNSTIQWWITNFNDGKVSEWRRKYKLISSKDWYLDRRSYGADWIRRYMIDPGDIYGGEACLWTEYIDENSATSIIWPITSAVAERLWSGAEVKDTTEAGPRIEEQTCRLKGRGIRAGVAGGPGQCAEPSIVISESKLYQNVLFDQLFNTNYCHKRLVLLMEVILIIVAISFLLLYMYKKHIFTMLINKTILAFTNLTQVIRRTRLKHVDIIAYAVIFYTILWIIFSQAQL